jgi:hypothetical protein
MHTWLEIPNGNFRLPRPALGVNDELGFLAEGFAVVAFRNDRPGEAQNFTVPAACGATHVAVKAHGAADRRGGPGDGDRDRR